MILGKALIWCWQISVTERSLRFRKNNGLFR
jgi:hypothetical protein